MQRKLFIAVLMFLIAAGWATASGQSNARIVRISDVEGQVDFYNGHGHDSATMNMSVKQGNRLVTRDDGWTEVQFEDGSTMRLAPGTDVVLNQLARSHGGAPLTQIDLNQGEAEFEVTHYGDSDDLFQVNVRQKAVVLHQAGRFRLASSSSDPLFLAVWSGEVGVRDPDSGGEVAVKRDETFALNPSDLGLYDLESGITGDSLDQWTRDRDDYLSKYAAGNGVGSLDPPADNGSGNFVQYVQFYEVPDDYDRDRDRDHHRDRDHDRDRDHPRITGGGPGPVPPPVWSGRKIGPPQISPGGGPMPIIRKIGPPEGSPGPVAGGDMPPVRKIGPPETAPGPVAGGQLPPTRKIGPPEGGPGPVAEGTVPPVRRIGPPDQQVNPGSSNGGSGQGFRNKPPEQTPTVTTSSVSVSSRPMGINPPPPQPVRTYTPPEPPTRSYNPPPPPPQRTYSPPPETARSSSPPPPPKSSSPPPAPPQTQSSPAKSSSSQAQNTDSSGKVKK